MAINIASNLKYNGSLPNFERDLYNTIEEMRNVDEHSLPSVFLGLCKETPDKIYIFNKSAEPSETLGKWKEFVSSSSGSSTPGEGGEGTVSSFQKEEMPTASDEYLGKIYQYIGITTEKFTNGYFYKCVVKEDVYCWDVWYVQPGEREDITLDIEKYVTDSLAEINDFFYGSTNTEDGGA